MDPDPAAPQVPDVLALRRRVLLTAVVTLTLFFAAAYALTALNASGGWLLPVLLLLWLLVVRPLLRPVREATALRQRLAYQAHLEQRR